MLYGNKSISQYSPENFSLWMLMAFQAGTINMGGYMACHRFVSHVTGFATFFGYETAHSGVYNAIGMLTVPCFFLLGTMLSGYLVDIRLKLGKEPNYYVTFGFMLLLIMIVLGAGELGYFGSFGETYSDFNDTILLALLCLVCGLQNGSITSVSRYAVRTTHLTGITTDLGIGLVRYFNRNKLKHEYSNETPANLMRIGIITFFILGSVAGGFAFKNLGYLGFGLPALTSGFLFALMIYFQLTRKHQTH